MGIFARDVLAGRVALTTGGGSGLGLAIWREFALLGASCVLVGRDEKKLDGAVPEIRAVGGQAIAVRADVREYAQVEHAVETAVEKFGALDILVNSAAGNFFCPSAELSPNGWRTVVDIDLTGTFLICPCARENRSLLS